MVQMDTSTMPAIVHAIGGSIGSASALLLLYPLERAKIEMQYRAGQYDNPNNNNNNNNDNKYSDNTKLSFDPLQSSSPQKQEIKSSIPILNSTNDNNHDENNNTKKTELAMMEEEDGESWNYIMSNQNELHNHHHHTNTNKMKQDIMHCFQELRFKKELYRGVGPIVSTLAVSNFVFFYIHQWMKQYWKAEKSNLRLLLSLFCSGTCNVLITNPLWVTNLRIMTITTTTTSLEHNHNNNNNNHNSHNTTTTTTTNLWKELYNIYQQEGWKTLWTGTGSSILLVSNPVIQFFLYEHLRRNHNPTPFRAFWTGALSKAIATIVTYPLQLTQAVMRLHRHKYTNIIDCLIQLYQRDGISGWFVGMRAKMLQSVFTAAFTFLTYEQILGAVQAAHFSLVDARIRAPSSK